MLDVQELSKAYGSRRALDAVNLDVARRDHGPARRNGRRQDDARVDRRRAAQRDSGRVVIGGIDAVAEPRRAQATLGLAPQETGVYPTLSCRDNLRLFTGVAGLGRRRHARQSTSLAVSLGLDRTCSTGASLELSGGERRRLHTAIAVGGSPRAGAARRGNGRSRCADRSQVLRVVRNLAHDGAAVVYSTHYFPRSQSSTRPSRSSNAAASSLAQHHQRHREHSVVPRRARLRGPRTRHRA